MIIDNNIIHYDFKKANGIKKTNSKNEQKTKNQTTEKLEPIPIETLRAIKFVNQENDNIAEMYNILGEMGYKVQGDLIVQGIKEYYEDAADMKDVRKNALEFSSKVEKDIKNLDIGTYRRVINFYKDGFENSSTKLKEEYSEDYEESESPTENSYIVMTNIADNFIKLFNNQYPNYTFETEDKLSHSGDIIYETIKVKDDNKVLIFDTKDFINSIINKKLTGENVVQLEDSKDKDCNYNYNLYEDTIEKKDNFYNITTGFVLGEEFSENGTPLFYVDDELLSGPMFYAIKSHNKYLYTQNKIKETIDFFKNSPEETKNRLRELAQKDENIETLMKNGYTPQYIFSTIRNNEFNPNVAYAMDYLEAPIALEWKYAFPSQDYINDIIEVISEDNYEFTYEKLDLARALLQKENESLSNTHQLVLNILNFLNENDTDDILDVLTDCAQNPYVEMEDMEELFEILQLYVENEKEEANGKLQALAYDNQDEFDDFNDALSFYSELLEPFSLDED